MVLCWVSESWKVDGYAVRMCGQRYIKFTTKSDVWFRQTHGRCHPTSKGLMSFHQSSRLGRSLWQLHRSCPKEKSRYERVYVVHTGTGLHMLQWSGVTTLPLSLSKNNLFKSIPFEIDYKIHKCKHAVIFGCRWATNLRIGMRNDF